MKFLIWFDGMAKPMPELIRSVPQRTATCPLIPTSSPAMLISGPPELPGLIAASVWIASV